MYYLIQRKADSMYFSDPDKCEGTYTPYLREAQWFTMQSHAERVRDGMYKSEDFRILEMSFKTVS